MLTSIRGLVAASLIAGSVLTAAPAFADETDPPSAITITGNVAGVTDYRFRGLSQTSGDPAIQGSININHSSGIYAGAWSSSLDFRAVGPAAVAVYGNQELDLYAGWTGPVASGLTFDGGLLYYAYPGGHVGKAEFFEPYASLTGAIGPVTAKAGVAYAWKQAALDFNADGKNDDNVYVYGELGSSIPNTPISVLGHLGWTKGALSPKFATGQTADYAGGFDYSIGASANVYKGLSLGVSYVGVDGNSIKKYSDDTVVGTIKYSF
ncbi:TorF family putative porin [Parablastomonas sp. CN1-191]|uniref:TorF family putative porin n=1 Tax=Parablastomonas sp. CN1-191 TaxID=3400908 RepID=UPI003BF8086F